MLSNQGTCSSQTLYILPAHPVNTQRLYLADYLHYMNECDRFMSSSCNFFEQKPLP